ncbi:hypothetical protein [Cohaesibacter haloalkalitolerans]|uniref:hypothetical protein n=1 Tax=Cohaesibacter haloalkalitolerans TaxID=1162980 RepID=UPI0013C49F09|nr:hypothetical protein [Cohaesibacter haloalkalitolerans]
MTARDAKSSLHGVKHQQGRAGVRLLAAAMLLAAAGCSATHQDFADSPSATSGLVAQTRTTNGTATSDKQATGKLASGNQAGEGQSMLLPSELGYSMSLLNEAQQTEDYPAVAVLSDKDPALLTPEERKALEAELLKLNKRAGN